MERKRVSQEVEFLSGIVKEKAEIFFNDNIIVHITTHQGFWWNGNILLLKDNLLILNDRVKGSIPLLYKEINKIEEYKGKEKM